MEINNCILLTTCDSPLLFSFFDSFSFPARIDRLYIFFSLSTNLHMSSIQLFQLLRTHVHAFTIILRTPGSLLIYWNRLWINFRPTRFFDTLAGFVYLSLPALVILARSCYTCPQLLNKLKKYTETK